jgi:hypothetical protein
MVKACCATEFHQLAHAGERTETYHIGVEILPYLVQVFEPRKELHVLDIGDVPRKHLIEMMVGVYKTRVAPHPLAVDDLGYIFKRGVCAKIAIDYLCNEIVFYKYRCVFKNAVFIVTGDDAVYIFYQYLAHCIFSCPQVGLASGVSEAERIRLNLIVKQACKAVNEIDFSQN